MKRAHIILILIVLTASLAGIAQAQAQTPTLDTPVITATPTSTGINLEWNPIEGASHYELWSWTAEEKGVSLGSTQKTTATHDQNLVAGRTYWYTVRAVGGNAESAWAEWTSAVAPTPSVHVDPCAGPATVDPCAGIGGDGCKFWLRDVDPADNGGGELKLLIGFVHGWRNDEVQVHGGYFVELQKDGVQVAGVDHNTRGGTNTIEGPRGRVYNYNKSVSASQLPGGNVAGTYTIWVKDGNGERDSQNHTFTLHGNQGLVWLVFDQSPR